MAKLQELTVDYFRNIRSKAGALLVVLPEELAQLSPEDKQVHKTQEKQFNRAQTAAKQENLIK